MNYCLWVWLGPGAGWGEHPNYPHNCPEGQTCQYPQGDGRLIGEFVATMCQ